MKTREGPDAKLMLKPGWKMAGVAKASLEDIKPGDFVGIASLPTSSGGDGAVEVLVFPPAMKGTGEGSYPWDLKPKSTMTNATVTNAVKGVDGRTLDLSYSGGKEKKISDPRRRSDCHFRPCDRGGPQARRDRLRSRPARRRRRARRGLRCRRHEWRRPADVGYLRNRGARRAGRLNGEAHELRAGDCLRIPRGDVHGSENVHDETARALIVLTPGSIGRAYFEEIAKAASGPASLIRRG